MKAMISGLAIGLMAMSLMACSKNAPQPAAQMPPDSLILQRAEAKTLEAKVVAVNLKTRKLTLSSPDGGQVYIIHVDKAAPNLPKVKKGDIVDVTYGRELEVRMAEPGDAINEQTVVVTKAKPGTKPRRAGLVETNVTAKILAVDKPNQLVKLVFIDGSEMVVKVQNPENLDKVKAGDNIAINYIEAVSITIKKPAKRK